MKRVLITGGCGFVGRHFARYFLADGCFVKLVDDLSTGKDPNDWDPCPYPNTHVRLNLYKGDVRYWFKCNSAKTYDIVIHCAAVVGGRLKIEGDPLAVATDLSIDSALFQWAVKAKPKKIIYFSSSAVYPIDLQTRNYHAKLAEALVDMNRTRLGMPDQTYGMAKFVGEYLAKQAVEKYGLDTIIYRPFSGYGEDQSLDYPFPSIIKRVVEGDDPIAIWGSGDQTRDFIHIDDIVDCVLQTMDVLKPGEVLNLGSGVPTSFAKLAWTAGTVICPERGPFKLHLDTSKPEGVFYRVADTSKMNQFYKPKVSLEEGIRRVAAHLRK